MATKQHHNHTINVKIQLPLKPPPQNHGSVFICASQGSCACNNNTQNTNPFKQLSKVPIYLRSGTEIIHAINAQFDNKSLNKLMQINTAEILCSITYNKYNSSYKLVSILKNGNISTVQDHTTMFSTIIQQPLPKV
eukprot:455273_1